MSTGSVNLLICHVCGTQFDVPAKAPLSACRICDDPRQYVPPTGQKWTSLGVEQSLGHINHIEALTVNLNSNSALKQPIDSTAETTATVDNAYSVFTEPKLGIGQRAILIKTPHGNVLWDCITYLDDATVSSIQSHGGLNAIVISHPHYYTTHLDWAKAFDCPVYIAAEDEEWVNRKDVNGRRRLIKKDTQEILPGVTAVKVGGHFPGSLVLHWDKKLFIADSIMTMPSALYHIDRQPGTHSYSFMWSLPNMIPLPPSQLLNIWRALQPFDFEQTHGAFVGTEVFDPEVKGRILQSMKIQVKNATGHEDHKIMSQKWP